MKLSTFSKMQFFEGYTLVAILNEVVDKKRCSNEDLEMHREQRYFSMWLPCLIMYGLEGKECQNLLSRMEEDTRTYLGFDASMVDFFLYRFWEYYFEHFTASASLKYGL